MTGLAPSNHDRSSEATPPERIDFYYLISCYDQGVVGLTAGLSRSVSVRTYICSVGGSASGSFSVSRRGLISSKFRPFVISSVFRSQSMNP